MLSPSYEQARRACDSLQTPSGWHGLLASPTTAVETEFVHAVGGGNKDLLTSLRCNNTAHPGCWSYSAGPYKDSAPGDLDDVKLGKLQGLKKSFRGDYLVITKQASAPNDMYMMIISLSPPAVFHPSFNPLAPSVVTLLVCVCPPPIRVRNRPRRSLARHACHRPHGRLAHCCSAGPAHSHHLHRQRGEGRLVVPINQLPKG